MDSQSPPNEVVQNISVAGKLAGLTGAGASIYIKAVQGRKVVPGYGGSLFSKNNREEREKL